MTEKTQNHLRYTDKQILFEFYKVQWHVLLDLDNLDWRIALIFVPLIAAVSFIFGITLELDLKELGLYVEAVRLGSLVSYLLCVYGLWTVTKGQVAATLKWKTLGKIEEDLRLCGYILRRSEKYRLRSKEYRVPWFWATIISRRFGLFLVYFILGLLSYSMWAVPINDWIQNLGFNLAKVWPAIIIPVIIVFAHFGDYKLHAFQEDRSKRIEGISNDKPS